MNYITLTNSGYKDLTLNLLKSMKVENIDNLLKIYTLDKECYDYLKKEYPNNKVEYINLDKLDNWIEYKAAQNPDTEGKKLWSTITFQKIVVIYEELKNNKDCIFIDGDIVIIKNPSEYLNNNIKDNDILIQNDECDNNDKNKACSGFMYIKSNIKTINIFNPDNIDKNKFINDQNYIRGQLKKIKYDVLDLELYPNGKYFRNFRPKNPYIIHFNHDVGKQKIERMKKYNYWYDSA